MFKYFIKCVKDNYININGRARRKEYWMFILVLNILLTILSIIHVPDIFIYIFMLALLLPTISVLIRRMHDVGKSGWYMLIPIYNLILVCTEGDKGENDYGQDPKEVEE